MAENDAPESHPNGPRGFANVLRDNVPLPGGVLERLQALETGRHPMLDELRAALGLDLSIAGWPAAARAAWPQGLVSSRSSRPQPAADVSDGDLARVIDEMHGALTSARRIAVELMAGGPTASRAEGAIVVRDEEQLVLLIYARNETDAGMRFSAEAHGEGFGGFIEGGRAGSGLFNAGPMGPGSYLLPVLIVAEGQPTTIDVPIECRPSGMLRVRIVDDATGKPIAARVYLRDDAGVVRPDGATIRRDVHGNGFVHVDGGFEARVSGRAHLRVARGIEYESNEQTIIVKADGEVETTVRLRRWSHMAADGWYSGDVHVHLHYGGEYLLTPADAALVQRAEDVNFMNMMVANQGSGWVHDAPYFEGKANALSDATHMLRWGEEYRNDFYGHMCMYGINELVPPIYSGVPLSEHPHDLPANADAARHCHAVGGTLSYAHPLFDTIELDGIFDGGRMRSVEAKELPVDAALGLIDAIDLMSYPGKNLVVAELWYRLLNCGLRLAATAGTDTFMNTADSGIFSNPPAGDRVFVRVEGEFSVESWCEGVRRGRTFATDAPMLSLEVEHVASSATHEIGDEIVAVRGDVLRVTGVAGSFVPMEAIELIVNGQVIESATATDGGTRASLTHEITVDGSCWLALRAIGPGSELVLDRDADSDANNGAVFAHTSPIYVTVDGAPMVAREDAAYFVEWIDRLVDMASDRGRYPSDEDRQRVAEIFGEGRAYYRRIATG